MYLITFSNNTGDLVLFDEKEQVDFNFQINQYNKSHIQYQ